MPLKENLQSATLFRDMGYWDGRTDRSQGHRQNTPWKKSYVYRDMKTFKKEYWNGYWSGYYNKQYDGLAEDAPTNNAGGGEIASIGVENPNKPAMWHEPGKDNKKRYKLMLLQMLGRRKPV